MRGEEQEEGAALLWLKWLVYSVGAGTKSQAPIDGATVCEEEHAQSSKADIRGGDCASVGCPCSPETNLDAGQDRLHGRLRTEQLRKLGGGACRSDADLRLVVLQQAHVRGEQLNPAIVQDSGCERERSASNALLLVTSAGYVGTELMARFAQPLSRNDWQPFLASYTISRDG